MQSIVVSGSVARDKRVSSSYSGERRVHLFAEITASDKRGLFDKQVTVSDKEVCCTAS